MQRKLKILFISSEIAPFTKTSSLADVAGALPKALKEMNHDIRLFIPKYGTINDRKYTIREVIRLKEIDVPEGDKIVITSVKSAFLPNSKVQVYFVENKDYFNRSEIYINPKTKKDWEDNAERFIFFSRSIFEILKKLHWQPDIIHCNDWQTALIPFFLKTVYKNDPFFGKTYTLLSIHNLTQQGIFDKKIAPLINNSEEKLHLNNVIDFQGKINFLKAGIVYADLINATSKSYVKEIQLDEESAMGLHEIFRARSKNLYGVNNGIDYTVWNPESDDLIPYNYSRKNILTKLKNKQSLVESQGLIFNEKIPVIGTILQLKDYHEGFNQIVEILDEMMAFDLQFILLLKRDEKYHDLLKSFIRKFPDKIVINMKSDNPLVHLMFAGCDCILIPCRTEPCGLNQIYCLRYGTIPIVHATGGLADTVKNYNPSTKRGYGFVFEEFSSESMLNTLIRALKSFNDKEIWNKLIDRAMKLEFSWQVAAENYNKLYQKLMK